MTPLRWLLLFVSGVLFKSGQLAASDTIILQLKWHHQFQFAGYYAAVAQGYYREAGLDVELREAIPGRDPALEVLEGRAQFGVGTSNIILLRAHGEPVVVLAVIYQHSPFVLLATRDSNVRDIHDMAHQPLMMEPDAAELLAYFKNEGVDPSTLHLIPHSFDALDLTRQKAGGMSAYSTDEPFHLKAAGIDYLVFSPRASGIDFYGDNLFTIQEQIDKDPERVSAFVKASLRGWEYAMRHPEEIVDLIRRDYTQKKTREQLLFEAEETARLVHPELIELGYINPGRWKSIARTYADLGMMPADFSLAGFIYARNRPLDLRWLYWLGGGGAFVVIAVLGWSLLTARINRRLRVEIEARGKAEEQARSQSEAKTHLIAILAHEVRSPLSGILGSLELCRILDSQQEKQEMMDTAEGSASNLLRMLDNLLGHAKLETGHMETEWVQVSLSGMMEEISTLFRAAIVAKSIDFRVEMAPAVPRVIVTDPTLLRQVISNLLSNAVKFSERGLLRISIDARPLEEGAQQIIFRVTDSGPGLRPEQIGKIFEPYTQADKSIARRYGGTGLGLAISSQFARLLGGEITVESEPGQGATFILTIRAEGCPHFSPATDSIQG